MPHKDDEPLDPRVVRTRRLLRDALLELISEKGFDAITVQDITERATLHRATFYLHYRDKQDLLMSTLEEMFDELVAYAEPPRDPQTVPLGEPIPSLVRQLEHIAAHADFYRAVMGSDGVPAFGVRLREWIGDLARSRLEMMGLNTDEWLVPVDLVIHYVTGAYVGLIRHWLEEGMRYPPEEMAIYIARLMTLGTHRVMGVEPPSESS
jgi:AcrR family transcriptional regulator